MDSCNEERIDKSYTATYVVKKVEEFIVDNNLPVTLQDYEYLATLLDYNRGWAFHTFKTIYDKVRPIPVHVEKKIPYSNPFKEKVYDIVEYVAIAQEITEKLKHSPKSVIHKVENYAIKHKIPIVYVQYKEIADILGYNQAWAYKKSKEFLVKAKTFKIKMPKLPYNHLKNSL